MSSMIPKNVNIWWFHWSWIITRENPSKRFQKQFPDHHKELVNMNGNQSIISRKIAWYFQKKVTTDSFYSDETLGDTKYCLSDTPEVISKLVEEKFRKPPGNINYWTFPPRWTKLCNIHRGSRKIKLFSPGTGFTGQVFTRNPLGRIYLGHWQSVSPLGWTHFKRTTCGSTLLTYKWKFSGNCSIHVNWTTMKFKFQYWQRFNVINKETRRCFITYLEDIKTDNVTPERIKYWANLFLITGKGQLNLRHWNSLAFRTSLADIFANFHHRCLMRP